MKHLFCMMSLSLLLGGCAAPATRQWLDSQTAATVTAQVEPLVLSREDFPAGVNVRDYVELGLFDVNRSGEHRHYLSLVLWSTVDRTTQQLSRQDETFASVTLWADDQPMVLARVTAEVQKTLVSSSIFRLPSPNAREAYYEMSREQLAALASARHIVLTPAEVTQGDRPYTLWRGELAPLTHFAKSLSD